MIQAPICQMQSFEGTAACNLNISGQSSENRTFREIDYSPFELNLSVGVAYLGGHFGSFGSAQNDSGIGQ